MHILLIVSVAGCLGYDVLEIKGKTIELFRLVSVAGCLGYDVLVKAKRCWCV
ncbi:hypothetical protein SPBRAN_780 [uncultured Candidatus Thioglobus sp.]|nr:hypothetical protein SPBRAN_780 [uncultured Candidatus Thioglobus sp.]